MKREVFPPLGVLTDSYKASHSVLYPEASKRTAYGEFRRSFEGDQNDHRIVFYGIQYIIDNYICRQWTREDLSRSLNFFSTHNIGYSPYPFPKELIEEVITLHNGWLPVRIRGLSEGSIIYPHTPIFTIEAEGKFSGMVTWLETLLTMVWYPCTVVTLSRRIRDTIEEAFEKSVTEGKQSSLIESRLHDFGFRGCTSVEQALIGGTAHLLNFTGSDTMIAAWNTQYNLNDGKPVAQSIPATEHSVMLAHQNEFDAVMQTIASFGEGVYACVFDTFDYMDALATLLPAISQHKMEKGGYLVIRPDSGDPVEAVQSALRAANSVFGSQTNSKGYKVINGCGVIQGDGINHATIKRILDAIMEEGYSAENVAFGMGGGLLQRVNRDTMSMATKLCYQRDVEGVGRDVCKIPLTDPAKNSIPGEFVVCCRNEDQTPIVYPKDDLPSDCHDIFITYYDCGPVNGRVDRTFSEIRDRLKNDWDNSPKLVDPLSDVIKSKIEKIKLERHQ